MPQILIFILGAAVGGAVVWVVVRKRLEGGEGFAAINRKRREEKEKAKIKILELLRERGEIANDDVENLLGISDATATNYLQELQDEGKIDQIGKEGRFVRYRAKVNG